MSCFCWRCVHAWSFSHRREFAGEVETSDENFRTDRIEFFHASRGALEVDIFNFEARFVLVCFVLQIQLKDADLVQHSRADTFHEFRAGLSTEAERVNQGLKRDLLAHHR